MKSHTPSTSLDRLANGIRVVCTPMPEATSVAMGIWIAAGGRHEEAAECGAAHFLEHVLFKGTRTRSAQAISEAIEGRGGFFDAFTDSDATCFQARILTKHAEDVFEVLADVVSNPRFARGDVEREREVIEEEIRMYRDDAPAVSEGQLAKALWGRHPLGRPVEGDLRSVAGLGKTELQAFWKRLYVPENMVVSFAGKIDPSTCQQWVMRHLGSLPNRPMPEYARLTFPQRHRRLRFIHKTVEQTHIALGYPMPGRHDPIRYAARLLAIALGGNMSSRLFQLLRERYGLAYAIHSGVTLYEEAGNLYVTAGMEHKNAERVLKLILDELRNVRERGFRKNELCRAKEYILGQLQMGLEGVMSQMTWFGESVLYHGKPLFMQDEICALEAVGEEDMRHAAKILLNPTNLALGMVIAKESIPEETWKEIVDEHA